MQPMRRALFDISLIFIVGLILFTWNLSSQEIIGFDSRFYLFAQEMLRNGLSWFPTTYQHAYPDYPSSSIVAVYSFAKMYGGLNKLSAVFPTAICAALTLVMTYLIGALQARRWGIYAVLLMVMTLTFFTSARSITLDMYPTLITSMCFYLVAVADKSRQPKLVWLIYPFIFLSFMFRGPIGLVIPTGVVCAYYLCAQEYKQMFITGFLALFLLIISTTLLLMLAQHVGGHAFVSDVLRMQILGRIDNPYLPIYSYFTNSFKMYVLTYPLAWLTVIGVGFYAFIQKQHTNSNRFILQLFAWMLVILIGMSIPDDKKERYILAMTPAISLLSAYIFFAPQEQKYFLILRRILNIFFLVLPLIFLIAILYLHQYTIDKNIVLPIHFVCVFISYAALQIANLTIYRRHQDLPMWRETLLLTTAAFSFVIAIIAIAEPIQLFLDKTHEFVMSVEAQRVAEHAKLVFYKETPDGTPIKYLINMNSDEHPDFLANEQQLMAYPAPAIFVTSKEYFDALPKDLAAQFHIITSGKIGHIPVIVFERQ